MRVIGLAERVGADVQAREVACQLRQARADRTVTLGRIANSRILIDQARLLVLNAAWMMDTVGNKIARKEIAMIKVAAPNMALTVIDWAIQAHGGAGVCEDFPLANMYAKARTLRLADGPDEVHRNQIGKLELARHA
jgi:acyl-CoA dehydrogenase